MKSTLEPAFILHQRPYRETSLLLDIFTQHHGRISAVAKGVRQKNSRTRALLQPFIPLLLSWYGKGELVTLSTVEINGSFVSLQGDCLLSGFYLNELLTRVLPKHDPHPLLYTIYAETLLELQGAVLEEKTLRIFEKKLLKELGYALPFENVLAEDGLYRFHPERGFELTEIQESVFLGKNLLAIARDELNAEELLRDAKRLMRMALSPLLGNYILQSRKLFIEVDVHAEKA